MNTEVKPQAVVAKMIVHSIEQFSTCSRVKLGAVYSTTGENKDFCDATPSGSCDMMILQDRPALSFFIPGESYYITFTKAPK